VTIPCPYDVAFVRRFNPNLPKRTVGDKIRRTIGQSILKAQFFGNVAEVRVQIFKLKGRKHSASGFFRESLEDLVSATVLVSAHSSRICTYRVNNDVISLNNLESLRHRDATRIIVTITDDHHDPPSGLLRQFSRSS